MAPSSFSSGGERDAVKLRLQVAANGKARSLPFKAQPINATAPIAFAAVFGLRESLFADKSAVHTRSDESTATLEGARRCDADDELL